VVEIGITTLETKKQGVDFKMKRIMFLLFSMISIVSLTPSLALSDAQDGIESKEKDPFKFNFGDIPFGKPMQEILKLAESAQIVDEYPSLDIRGDYIEFYRNFYGRYKKWSIFSATDLTLDFLSSDLSSDFVKGVCVSVREWENTKLKLFFTRKYGSEGAPILFLVYKIINLDHPIDDGDANKLLSELSKKIGVQPLINKTIFCISPLIPGGSGYPARYAYWTVKDQEVFILLAKGEYKVHLLYRSKTSWGKYIESRDAYDEAKKATEQMNREESLKGAAGKF